MTTPKIRAERLIRLYRLRANVEAEITAIECAIDRERDAIARAREAAAEVGASTRRRAVAECGTDGGYYRHRRTLQQDACAACKLAHRVAERQRQQRARAAGPVAAVAMSETKRQGAA